MLTYSLTSASRSPRPNTAAGCPFRDGPANLDGLLAEIGPQGGEALDTALDLRFAYQRRHDAGECVALVLRLRRVLGDRHYLAHYRVRHWLARALALEVRAHGGEAWQRIPLPFHATPPAGGLVAAVVAYWAQGGLGRDARFAQVRPVFVEAPGCAAAPVAS